MWRGYRGKLWECLGTVVASVVLLWQAVPETVPDITEPAPSRKDRLITYLEQGYKVSTVVAAHLLSCFFCGGSRAPPPDFTHMQAWKTFVLERTRIHALQLPLPYSLPTWQVSAEEGAKREAFERAITRSFFTVKPLAEDQLRNWRAYIAFEEANGDIVRALHTPLNRIPSRCRHSL